MTTARDFILLALKESGVLGVGQSPLPEDINDCFTLLNRMLAQWQKKRWIVPSLYDISAIGNSQKSNLIGPGQYYNAARPDKIQAAYFIQITGNSQSNPVSFPLSPIWSYENYSNITLKQLNSWPQFFFYDAAFPYGNVFIWPIPTSQYEIHLIVKSPIGFTIEIQDGTIKTAGAGYVNGVYLNVPLINLTGFGSGATADITVAGGIVTVFTLNNPGDGYKINDNLSVNNASLGGTGAGLVWVVNNVTDDLNAVFNMPPEYEEAIHYNLCIRISSMYQYPVNAIQAGLAKLALNTIKIANAQIPTLEMPRSLKSNRGNNFYIFNADSF
jgi:hypothetical protein